MDITKRNKVIERLLFLYLVLFPFGQILRINLKFGEKGFALHPVDLVAFSFLLLFLLWRLPRPQIFKSIKAFLIAATFSLLFSLAFFGLESVIFGSFYLLRLFSYFSIVLVLSDFLKEKIKLKEKIFTSLLLVLTALGVFGWIQYFFYPDARGLYWLGWDDHFYRLLGTILDPGFMGILLVFGLLMSLAGFIYKRKNYFLFLSLFFLVSIAFTYARSAYLALISGSIVLLAAKKRFKELFLTILVFAAVVIFLPKPGGEGVNLQRLNSIRQRIENYQESLILIKKSPVFGVGFNNLCIAKEKFLQNYVLRSHSCSGLDSSLLFVLATTGVVGFLVFINLAINLTARVGTDLYGLVFLSSLAAVLVDSLFLNSLFYAWVMGYLAIIFALSYKEK